ncbi:hypothetical protein INR49_023566 [Caranx melampygus]|nr:hypothetical protein INR49_023566 [Caranx melampygus]
MCSSVTFRTSKMAAPVIETCHIACCANRTPNVVSWSRGGTIAFGTCNSVALYDPQERRVVAVLNGHTGRVNAVQWVHREDCALERYLVSGGSDNRLILWEAQNDKFSQSVECKGHTGAICAVDAIYTEASKILVASSASDSTVRLWLCSENKEVPVLACGGDDSRVHLYVQSNGQYQKAMSLQGHEDWVRGLAWASIGGELLLASCSQDCLIRVWRLCAKSGTDTRTKDDHTIIKMKEDVFEVRDRGGELEQPLSLLSASMDKTMILWAPEEGSGVWVEQVRVGEVGGNTLGFYGCQMSPDGSMIVAHAFHGALHLWCKDLDKEGEWRPGVVISGHFNAVQDLSWDPEGEFILSVGSDQTTRLFTPWRKQDGKLATWHEISRPQIHGYDMQCLAMVGRFQFVSGADEKVLRVFQAPRNFVENYANISGTSKEKLLSSSDAANLPEGASTPALGLSNKAVFQGDLAPKNSEEEQQFSSVSDQYQESYFHPLNITEPPPEDHLLQNTLWPEVQKLYGHGFEMFCLASDSARTVVASACKASKSEHAAVLLWSTATWRQLQTLPCHTLTVTQMAFSPDAQLLLAVSRDRTWSLWKRNQLTPESPEPQFSLHTHTGKDTAVHSRIIWSCDWSPDSKYFVTSSRDKKCGRILLYRWSPEQEAAGEQGWISCGGTDTLQSHALAVKRLRWRPRAGRAGQQDDKKDGQPDGESEIEEESSWLQLASASADHTVKIFNINKLAV